MVQPHEALGEADDAFVEVAAVHVQRGLLGGHRLGHAGVAMTHAGHVVVQVEVAAAVRVEEFHAVASHEVQRLGVEELRASAQRPIAPILKCSVHSTGSRSPELECFELGLRPSTISGVSRSTGPGMSWGSE